MASSVMSSRKSRPPGRGICLLSLDGGGIRGIAELVIIEELMHRVKGEEGLDEVPILADRFDMIGGTSTGGIIAILLGRLRLSAADAINVYQNLAKDIFSEHKPKYKEGTYKASKLENVIKDVVKRYDNNRDADAKMYDEQLGDIQCRAFVCAASGADITHAAGPTLFRSYDVVKNKEDNCTIWEAARATTAAPTFFKSITIGPQGAGTKYVDAGIGCNNPVQQVIHEARRVFGEDAHISCIVSVGTGQSESVRLAEQNALRKLFPTHLVEVLKKIATDTGKVAENMDRSYANAPGLYTRLDVDHGLGNISLDEWNKLGDVRRHTKNYLRLPNVEKRVDEVSRHNCLVFATSLTLDSWRNPTIKGSTYMLSDYIPHSQVSHFVARPAISSEIEDILFDRTSESTAVLVGMGGAGKTQLALDICHKQECYSHFAVLAWIDATSPLSVEQGYKLMAKTILPGQQGDRDVDAMISELWNKMQEQEQDSLLVFDNYDNPNAFPDPGIRKYLRRAHQVRVILTSRNAGSARLGREIKVAEMTENESLEVLLQRDSISQDEILNARAVASMLGHLALALDQAGAYIRARGLHLAEFLSHYHNRKKIVLRCIPSDWEYFKYDDKEEKMKKLSAFTTWELSFDQISDFKEEKEHFLSLAALFDIRSISEKYLETLFTAVKPEWMKIFNSDCKWDSYKLADILAEFQQLSLTSIREGGYNGQCFSIHPMIRDWISVRKNSIVHEAVVEELMIALSSYLKIAPPASLPLEARQETLLHVDNWRHGDNWVASSVLQNRIENSLPTLQAYIEFTNLYNFEERAHEAEQLCNQALSCKKGLLDPIIQDSLRSKLAFSYYVQNKLEDAEALYSSIFINKKELRGLDHPETLNALRKLGDILRRMSKSDVAEETLQQAVVGLEKKAGPKHVDTIYAMMSLAHIYRYKGRLEDAARLCEQALAVLKECYGAGDFESLRLENDLGVIYTEQRRLDSAESLLQHSSLYLKHRVGPKHPWTLRSMAALAYLYHNQSRYDSAIETFEFVFAARAELLGHTHPDTIRTVWTLVDVYCSKGRYGKARTHLERTLSTLENSLGDKNDNTLATLYRLAYVSHKQGHLEDAEELCKRALAGQEETLGDKHEFTLTTVASLAYMLQEKGCLDPAEKLYRRALDGREETLGLKHKHTLTTAHSFAVFLENQGNLEAAEELYKRALAGREETLGHGHKNTVTTRRCLEMLWKEQSTVNASLKRRFKATFRRR
ncbi:hypothetical protein ACLMJK_005694 [Lecanora helva]